MTGKMSSDHYESLHDWQRFFVQQLKKAFKRIRKKVASQDLHPEL